jgi:hypothetical protein
LYGVAYYSICFILLLVILVFLDVSRKVRITSNMKWREYYFRGGGVRARGVTSSEAGRESSAIEEPDVRLQKKRDNAPKIGARKRTMVLILLGKMLRHPAPPPPTPPPPPPLNPSPTPPPLHPLASAAPRILRRLPPEQDPAANNRFDRDRERFFSDSPPPPPPRNGVPTRADDEEVPETPDPAARWVDPQPGAADRTWVRPGRASFTEVIRGGVNAPRLDPAMRHPHAAYRAPQRTSCISTPDVTGERRLHYGGRSNPRKIWQPCQPSVLPADVPVLEPGWTPARRRKRPPRLTSPPPPRRDDRQDRRRSAPSSRPTTSALQAFIKATAGRCFNCLARDHRAPQCRDPVRCFRCRRSGHRERFYRQLPRQPTGGRAPPLLHRLPSSDGYRRPPHAAG